MVLLVNILVAAALLVVACSDRLVLAAGYKSAALAALPLLDAAVLGAYVFGEDDYRNNGTSRWDAYRSPGGALGPMFILSVALMIACAALLVCFAIQGRRSRFRSTAGAGGLVALLLLTVTIAGFSLN